VRRRTHCTSKGGLSFRVKYANRYSSVNIAGWAVLPVASGMGV
jgi:hypothetical protein